MSVFRRWLDPVQSRFIHQMTHTQLRLPTRNPIELWLRFDDAYSYLLVQLLPKLISQLKQGNKYLHIYVAFNPTARTQTKPNTCYILQDAFALAEQHRLIFLDPITPTTATPGIQTDNTSHQLLPSITAQQQAATILRYSSLTHGDRVHLLIQVFHMLWQGQHKKLQLLAKKSQLTQQEQQNMVTNLHVKNKTIHQGYWCFAGQTFKGFDGFISLTKQLKNSQLLKPEAFFLLNHIEWGEKIINAPEDIADIHEQHAELEVFVALEDPYSYLALHYLYYELAAYYHIKLKLRLIPYQQRDHFNWSRVASLAKHMNIEFAPFCRPTETATLLMACTLYAEKKHHRIKTALKLMQAAWTKANDLQLTKTYAKLVPKLNPLTEQKVVGKLNKNQTILTGLHQPSLPTFRLTITRLHDRHIATNAHKHGHVSSCPKSPQPMVFSGINRLWRVQTELAKTLAVE